VINFILFHVSPTWHTHETQTELNKFLEGGMSFFFSLSCQHGNITITFYCS
jgi:hypothetical protein